MVKKLWRRYRIEGGMPELRKPGRSVFKLQMRRGLI